MYLTSENGACIKTWVYVNDDPKEQSLLGERDASQLGVVYLNLKGANKEVDLEDLQTESVNRIGYSRKSKEPDDIVSGGESQQTIDERKKTVVEKLPTAFSDRTGKCKNCDSTS